MALREAVAPIVAARPVKLRRLAVTRNPPLVAGTSPQPISC